MPAGFTNAGPMTEVFRRPAYEAPTVSFCTLGPFGGGRVSLGQWPKVRSDLESGVARFRICAFTAQLNGSLV